MKPLTPVPDYPLYAADEDGNVYSCAKHWTRRETWRRLNPYLGARYPRITLHRDGRMLVEHVHIIILRTFRGERPTPSHQSRHLDGNRQNNALANLAWGTVQENADDRTRHGTQTHGSGSPNAKLSEEAVADIKAGLAAGVEGARLARRYGVWPQTIGWIKSGRSWKHVPSPPDLETTGLLPIRELGLKS
jgi:hypothetical protein